MKRVLISNHHGLGDCVLLTPALRKYKEKNPDSYIAVACMRRFNNKVGQLLSDLPYIDEVIPCLSDAWNDFGSYAEGIEAVTKEAKEIAEEKKFDKVIVLLCQRTHDDYRLHKIFRFANELGVEFESLNDLQTELSINKEADEKVEEFLKDIPKPILVLHNKAGNPPKEFSEEEINKVLENYRGYSILEFGKKSSSKSIEISEDDMEFTKALINRADFVVAIDSVVMHVAGAFNKKMIVLFKSTSAHQVIPLNYSIIVAGYDNEITQISKLPEYTEQVAEKYGEVINTTKLYNRKSEDHIKRWNAIKPYLELDSPVSILDIGCNTGIFSFLAAALGHDVWGIDNDVECIKAAKDIAKKEEVENVDFGVVDDLLTYLIGIEDNTFTYTFYLSIHHHIYEQYDATTADKILEEISRVSENMIFEMGTTDEEGSEWTPWIKLIPQFSNPKKDVAKHVIDKSGYSCCDILTSTNIHGAERWLYLLSTLRRDVGLIRFGDTGFLVDSYIWRTEGAKGELRKSDISFPDFDYDAETKVRYYKVHDNSGKAFFVKEILYQPWLKLTPEIAAKNEFERGQVLLADENIAPYVIAPLAINNNKLLMDYIDGSWKRLDEHEPLSLPVELYNEITRVALLIREKFEYDYNSNNIYIKGGEFKFIDFGYAECEWDIRSKVIASYFQNASKPAQVEIFGTRELTRNYYHPLCYWAHMITFRCNGNCEFCIVDGRGPHVKRKELSGQEILDWWNSLVHAKGQRLSLIGGEPSLHKDIVGIVNNLEGYGITITTNCKGKFFEDPEFATKFKPLPSSTLRINTSFHPHAISPERYIEVIKAFRDVGHHVDQTAYVSTPDVIEKYGDALERVTDLYNTAFSPKESKIVSLKTPPFLGFWNEKDGYKAEQIPKNLWPNESYYDQDGARILCGIDDYDLYRDICGQPKGKKIRCGHPLISLIVAPDGKIHGCHYRLYYNLNPVGDIKDFKPVTLDNMKCNFYGLCNFCDMPRFKIVNSIT